MWRPLPDHVDHILLNLAAHDENSSTVGLSLEKVNSKDVSKPSCIKIVATSKLVEKYVIWT